MPTVGVFCAAIITAIRRRANVIRNVVVVLLVWAVKEALTELFFHCPCYNVSPGSSLPVKRVVYGSLFIAVPGVVLWVIGVLLAERTWRCVAACTSRPCPPVSRGCGCFWGVLGASALAPVTWAVLVFLDGSYLECILAYVPTTCVSNTTAEAELTAITSRNMDAHWLSGVIGCSIAGATILIYLISALSCYCCGNTSYYQRLYAEEVRSLEVEAMTDAAREHNLPLFKAKWQAVFTSGTADNWKDASSLPFITPQPADRGFTYTAFHAMTLSNYHSQTNGYPDHSEKFRDDESRDETEQRKSITSEKGKRALPAIGPLEANPYAHAQVLPGYDARSGLGRIVDDTVNQSMKKKKRKKKGRVSITPED